MQSNNKDNENGKKEETLSLSLCNTHIFEHNVSTEKHGKLSFPFLLTLICARTRKLFSTLFLLCMTTQRLYLFYSRLVYVFVLIFLAPNCVNVCLD